MTFEFDPDKSQSNKRKHGIDFREAQQLWTDPNRVEFVAQFKDEERYGIIAALEEKVWCGICTIRDGKIRIISVRRARKNEEKIYHNR